MRLSLVLFAPLLLLWAVVAEVNHTLASLHLCLFAGGLFVASIALHQPLRPGLFATLAAALVCDAHAPVPFGTHFLLFAAAHVFVFRLRDRIPRGDNVATTVVVLFANLGIFLGLVFVEARAVSTPASLWPRLLADLIVSQLALVVVTPWFFALQARALGLAQTLAAFRSRQAA
ncbi:MAG: hypothetical protein HZC55_12090 [Verrucomicrobia bacterium]|nr:hypothetical protein [Verrucomicrobiota bacterium]